MGLSVYLLRCTFSSPVVSNEIVNPRFWLVVAVVLQVVPVLRAGLVLLEQAFTVLPASQTFHVGYARDESTLEVRNSYCVPCQTPWYNLVNA